MKVYKDKDLEKIKPIIERAIKAMLKAIDEQGLRDGGSCVLGEGLDIAYLPPRCKNARRLQIVRQPFQGNNERALRVAQAYLEKHGIETSYNYGRMD